MYNCKSIGFVNFPTENFEFLSQILENQFGKFSPVRIDNLGSAPWTINYLVPTDLIFIQYDDEPGEDQLTKMLIDLESLVHIPKLCFISAKDNQKSIRALQLGAKDFVSKDDNVALILARVKTQLRHRKFLDRLEEIAQDRDLFAAGVLHDIKGLESTILATSENCLAMLENKEENYKESIQKFVTNLIKKSQHLSEYAQEVIQSLKNENAASKFEPVNPVELVEWAKTVMLGKSPGTEITLEIIIQENLKSILADTRKLKMAILNILENAAKYSEVDGCVKIEIGQKKPINQSPTKEPNTKENIITYFRDHGPGVEKSHLKKIFKPFTRGNDVMEKKGSGLGLAMVAKAISTMHGKVWAETPDSGRGFQVCIELPLSK